MYDVSIPQRLLLEAQSANKPPTEKESYADPSEDDDDDEDDDPSGHSLDCICERCIQNHPERESYLDAQDDG